MPRNDLSVVVDQGEDFYRRRESFPLIFPAGAGVDDG